MTDAELAAILFLRDNTARVVRVEVDYQYESGGVPATGTFYFSNNAEYRDANPYVDAIEKIPEYSRSLNGDLRNHSSSLGSLEIQNPDGLLDYVLGLAIDGSEVRVTMCALDTPAATLLIFKCYAVKASAPSMGRISIQLKDTGMLLDQSIGGTIKVGGTGPDADRWRTKNFGLVHQVQCKVVDPVLLIYTHSDTGYGQAFTAGSFVETVRDRGVPVVFTDHGDGTFTLARSPSGTITADVLYVVPGPGSEYRCVSDAMSTLIAPYTDIYVGPGPTYSARPNAAVGTWLSAGGEDYQIGVSLDERRNALDFLSELCDSGLCFWAVTRLNGFTYGRLRPNYIAGLGLTAAHTITEDDLIDDDFQMDELPALYHQLQATMSKNWSIQTNLATSLTPAEVAKFTRQGLYVLQNQGVGTTYATAPQLYNKTLVQSKTIDTLLSGADDTTDAGLLQLWMETRRAMMLPKLRVATCTVGIEFYDVEIGDPITVRIPRFGYDAGVDFQVIAVNIKAPNKVYLKMIRREAQAPYVSRVTAPPDGPPYSGTAKLLGASVSFIAGVAFASIGGAADAAAQVFTSTVSFIPGIASSGTTTGGPFIQAAYVTIGNDANLTNERALTAGSGITITDNGPNSTVVVNATAGAGSPLTTKGDVWGYDTADNRIPIGTNDYVLTADSAQALGLKWAPVASSGGGVLQGQEFTTSGTFTVPTAVTAVWVTMVGGGGGGAGSASAGGSGGGGGAGEVAENVMVKVTAAGSVTVTIGGGGAGGSAGSGSAGTATSFGSVYTARGGAGGTIASGGSGGGAGGGLGASNSNVGALGVASAPCYQGGGGGGGGDNNNHTAGGAGASAGGYAGGVGGAIASTKGGGGGGASTIFGIGGTGGAGEAVGVAAASTSYGAGGGGGGSNASTARVGAAGAAGYCLVTWIS